MTDPASRPAVTAHDIDLACARLEALAAEGAPADALFATMQAICDGLFGVRLFSVLLWNPAADAILRVYSSDAARYPTGVWKPMGPTPWGERLLKGGAPVKCHDEAELRWAFPDADLLISMDCAANLASPVLAEGRTLGVVSISETGGHYRDGDLPLYHRLAQALRPAFEQELARTAPMFSA